MLVNNAGITTPVAHDDLDALTDEWIDKIFATNFRGAFTMIRACKNLLMKSDDALVVNISSVAGEAVVKFPETYRLEVVADVRVALVAVRLVKAAVRAVRRAEKKLVVVELVREAFSE